METLLKNRCLSLTDLLYLSSLLDSFSPSALHPFEKLQALLAANMDQAHSNALEVDNHTPPQQCFTPLHAGLQSIAYAAPRSQWVVAIQKFDGSSYLLSLPLYDWDTGKQAFLRAREQLSKVSRRRYRERFMSMLIIKTVVGTARVNRVRAEYSCQSSLSHDLLTLLVKDHDLPPRSTKSSTNPPALLTTSAQFYSVPPALRTIRVKGSLLFGECSINSRSQGS